MRLGCKRVHIALFFCVLATCLGVRADGLTNPADTADPPDPSSFEASPSDEPVDDLDKLLDMDPEQLSQVSVQETATSTFTDPVVEGVSKTAEKASESAGIVDVITAEEIDAYGAKNLYEVLQRATSLFMTGSFMHANNVAAVRGNLIKHEDNHVLILINGRPLREGTTGGINWAVYKAFPLQTIQRIEVMRGPGSVLYGTNAFTGVINIVTKTPAAMQQHASTLAGSHGFQRHQLAYGAGCQHQGLMIGATHLQQAGWPFRAVLEDSLLATGRYGEEQIGLFAQYRKRGFTANVLLADAGQMVVGSTPLSPIVDSNHLSLFVDLGYHYEIDQQQSLQVNFTYNHSQFDILATVPSFAPYKIVADGYLAEVTYRNELSERWNLMLDGVADTHQGYDWLEGTPPGSAVDPFTETWYGVYLQLNYQPTDWLKLVGGMQGNMPGVIPGGIVPRAGVIANLTDNLTGKLLYGQAFRSPYQLERSIDAAPFLQGNPGLTPETIQTFDVQLAYTTEDYRLAGTLFHSDFRGVVSRIGTTPQTFVNQGNIAYRGFELENDWRLNSLWTWTGSVSYQDNVRDGVHNTTSAPMWMAKLGLAYDNPDTGVRVGLFDTFIGDQFVQPTATVVNSNPNAYHLVSLNSSLDLPKLLGRTGHGGSLRAQFLIQNLLNEGIHHYEFERELLNSIPAGAGRTFYGGLTWER